VDKGILNIIRGVQPFSDSVLLDQTVYGGTAKTNFWAVLPLNLASAKGAAWLVFAFLQERRL